jgi:Protein of unknown function (DUF2934)
MLERRIATALWNREERERIIAMRAFELFDKRGRQDGYDLEDWLTVEAELSLTEGEVVLEQSDEGIDISISAARAEPGRMMLSLSPESVLILWTTSEDEAEDREAEPRRPTLSLIPLPRTVDPYADRALPVSQSEMSQKAASAVGKVRDGG